MMRSLALPRLRLHLHQGTRCPAILYSCLLTVALSACATSGAGGSSPTPTSSASTPTSVPFTVTSVDLAVDPASIAGTSCGTSITFTYTAIFHLPADTAGGTIQFAYTLNNGRSQTPASVTSSAGQTSVTYPFTSSGTLPADHTYPGVAIVMVTSPNPVQSPSVMPTGTCSTAGAFRVTSISMAVSPTSIAGLACGTRVTLTYTATFHLAPTGPGGTIQFQYTFNSGRSTTPASLTVAPGQTTGTYSVTLSGNLTVDHTWPEPGGVMVTSPNAVSAGFPVPSGTCS